VRLVAAFGAVAAGLIALVAVLAQAADGRVPLPKPAKATAGTQCVEPAAEMRRNHMVHLEHQRDETLREGIRGKKHSLRDCVSCHAAPDPKAGGQATARPFCDACHAYAAVTIDCFGCHATKPEAGRAR